MVYGFQRNSKGLAPPTPAGLPGFQRQRMDQTKKATRSVASFVATSYFADVVNTDTVIIVTNPPGLRVGDIGILHVAGNASGTPDMGGGPWSAIDNTTTGNFAASGLWYKVLNAADVAATTWGLGSSGGGTRTAGDLVVYRPPSVLTALNTVTLKQVATFAVSTATLRSMTPFVVAPGAWLHISLMLDDLATAANTPPFNWTPRFSTNKNGAQNTHFVMADANSLWGSNSAIDWSAGDGVNAAAQVVWVVEFA